MEFGKYIDAGLPIFGFLLVFSNLVYIIGFMNLVVALATFVVLGLLFTTLSYILGWISINVVHRSKR